MTAPVPGEGAPRTQTSGTTTHVPQPAEGSLHPGLVLDERYEIREQLGRGGMGVVWLAHDLKLRVDVALKAVRPDQLASEKRRELLRAEVRAAREVVSPNVCRVFDLVVEGGHELVSMEYVDGVTLANLLEERAPLDVAEARDLAAQFLAGLEAIHHAGLVHRDFKPENVMVTAAGRVVVMDLGIAQRPEDPRGTVVGTPAYMAPELSGGGALDARADVFAAGVTLAEMTTSSGGDGRKDLLEGLRSDPPHVPEGPWAGVIRKAVSHHAGDRYTSARELSRALDNVTLRVVGEDDRRPYPGLAAFTEDEAEHFYGREAEVEALLRKLAPAARLLAIAGPSGAGKSSFLRAGLVASLPEGWRAVVVHHGGGPFAALAAALVPELSGDDEATNELVRMEEPDAAVSAFRRWRKRHGRVVLMVDQLEELFTLCPPEVQARFAALLGRLPVEADVHVLVSIRDDFLLRCHEHDALAPLFAELTPLAAPTGAALRRALVQPALTCGYRFEDESLATEMLAEVEKERGALPLLSFAAARLWDERDRDNGILTRAAYESIGGVAGALARHAEATLARIGPAREPIVRELFRNLVTAQGTRAARERDELLSVFEDGKAAQEVLSALVDARLLTTWEPPAAESVTGPRQRIEIIHESLLSAWPRLLRWQTQDADGARLRDQLRQAAALWDERGRSQELLWTGPAYRDLALWKERYPGGLTTVEEAFADAATTLAARRRRWRSLAVALLVGSSLAVAGVMSALRDSAVQEAQRAEAQRLLALAQLDLETSPTAALAYATESLDHADTDEARMLALRALAAGPPATVLALEGAHEADSAFGVDFSPDGRWAMLAGHTTVQVVSRDGRTHRVLEPFPTTAGAIDAAFGLAGEYLYASKIDEFRAWSVPGFRLVERQPLPGDRLPDPAVTKLPRTLISTRATQIALTDELRDGSGEIAVTAHAVGAAPRFVARLQATLDTPVDVDPSGRWLALGRESRVQLRSLEDPDRPARIVGTLPDPIASIAFSPRRELLAASGEHEVRVWSIASGAADLLRSLPVPEPSTVQFDRAGRRLVTFGRTTALEVWDLETSAESAPWRFPASPFPGAGPVRSARFTPDGRWLLTSDLRHLVFWPVARAGPRILLGHQDVVKDLAFTPDGGHLLSVDTSGEVRRWPLRPGARSEVLAQVARGGAGPVRLLAVDPRGRFVVVTQSTGALVVPLDGGETRALDGLQPDTWTGGVAVDSTGRLVAAAAFRGPAAEKVIRLWDLETSESRTLGPTETAGENFDGGVLGLRFLPDGSLLSSGHGGLRRWSIRDGTHETVAPSYSQSFLAVSGDGRYAFHSRESDASGVVEHVITDLRSGVSEALTGRGNALQSRLALDPTSGAIVSSGEDVRVGASPTTEPHIFLGHPPALTVAVSPDGQWVASGHADGGIRLWPMPDLSRPPLQALPRDALLDTLRSLTNVRVVEDPADPTRWMVSVGPFPGWDEVPEW